MESWQLFGVIATTLVAAAAQAWFWHLRRNEERSLWLGLSALTALLTLVAAVEVALLLAFPPEEHPVLLDVNLWVLGICAAALLAFPVTLVVTLIASGIRLIRREGASWRNMLSLGLGLAMVAYALVWPAVRRFLSSIPVLGTALDFVFGFVAILLGIAAVAFTLYTLSGIVAQVPHRRRRYDAVVVLGAGLMPDGSVTPLLARRVDRGVQMWRRQPDAWLVMSGGQGPDEAQPESHAMREYALSLGVPAARILVEDGSRSTQENLALTRQLLLATPRPDARALEEGDAAGTGANSAGKGTEEGVPGREPSGRGADTQEGAREPGRILVVTDDYHVFRALLITRMLGIPADGVGSHVRLYFSLNALVREWVAYISLHRKFYARLTGTILAVYVAVPALTALLTRG